MPCTTRSAAMRGLLVLLVAVGAARADEASTARYELDNGLRVVLRPVRGSVETTLCVLFDVGEDHDPAGRSGLAHFVEHCYVTAAAGDVAARDAHEMAAVYEGKWNAQTGARYTVVAFTFPSDRLETEIAEAAARMGSLRITGEDVERERPRILGELRNMYGWIPILGAANFAREQVRPSPPGGRKGGVPAQVEAMTREEIAHHHARYYKPTNAHLVIAGGLDVETAKDLVAKHFGPLPPGETLPPAGAAQPPTPKGLVVHDVPDGPPGAAAYATLAFAAPTPDSPHYAPFLALAHRLLAAAMKAKSPADVTAHYAPLDEPEVVYIQGMLNDDETPEAAVDRLRAFFDGIARRPLTLGDTALARQQLAPLLATVHLPDVFLQANSYAVAFGLGRRAQLGIDGKALGEALLAVDAPAYARMVEAVFAGGRGAAVVVRRPPVDDGR